MLSQNNEIDKLVQKIFFYQSDERAREARAHVLNDPANGQWASNQTTHDKAVMMTIAQGLKGLEAHFSSEFEAFAQQDNASIMKSMGDALEKANISSSLQEKALPLIEAALNRSTEIGQMPEREQMLLCWLAAIDSSTDSFDEMFDDSQNGNNQNAINDKVHQRLSYFLTNYINRVTNDGRVCAQGKRNAIYESIAGMHTKAPKVLDKEAARSIIRKTYDESMQAYLASQGDLSMIREWTEDSIFVDKKTEKKKVILEIKNRLSNRGYHADQLFGLLNKDIAQNNVKYPDVIFFACPPFLSKLTEFEALLPHVDIYDAAFYTAENPSLIDYYRAVFLEARAAVVRSFKDYLPETLNAAFNERDFQEMADQLLSLQPISPVTKAVSGKAKLTQAAFNSICVQITKPSQSLSGCIQADLSNHFLEHLKIQDENADYIEHFVWAQINACLKRGDNIAFIINSLKSFNADARYVMWVLCRLYRQAERHDEKETQRRRHAGYDAEEAECHDKKEQAAMLLNVILFMKHQGVIPEDCFFGGQSAAEFIIKSKNQSTQYKVLSLETVCKLHKSERDRLYVNFIGQLSFIARVAIALALTPFSPLILVFGDAIKRFVSNCLLINKATRLIARHKQSMPPQFQAQNQDVFFRNARFNDFKMALNPLIKMIDMKNVKFYKNTIQPIVDGMGDLISSPFAPPSYRQKLIQALHGLANLCRGIVGIFIWPAKLAVCFAGMIVESISDQSIHAAAKKISDSVPSSSHRQMERYFAEARKIHHAYKNTYQQRLHVDEGDRLPLTKKAEKIAWQKTKMAFLNYKANANSETDEIRKKSLAAYAEQFSTLTARR